MIKENCSTKLITQDKICDKMSVKGVCVCTATAGSVSYIKAVQK